MTINYNPSTTINGLILCVDAANPASYPGSGSIWKDLSNDNNNLTMAGSLSYASGVFTSTATVANYWYISNFDYPPLTVTTEMWVRCNSGSSFDGLWSYSSYTSDNTSLLYDQSNLAIFVPGTSISTGIAINDNTWKHLVRVSNRTSGLELLYVNGALAFSNTLNPGVEYTRSGTLILGQEQDSLGSGLDANQALEGSYSIFKIYNRELSATEVLRNFIAIRGRYGI